MDMVELTPHDSAVLSRLVQFSGLPFEQRKEMLTELSGDARMVGEAVLDPLKYSASPQPVRATVDRFQNWLEANRRIGRLRRARGRNARSR